MFESKAVKAIIQNHKESPNTWVYIPHDSLVINELHAVRLRWTRNFTGLYVVKIKGIDYNDRTNIIDKYVLTKYFKKVFYTNPRKCPMPTIPTKKDNPENFI